jgi:hypothetical protein
MVLPVDGENRLIVVDWGNNCIRSIVGARRNGFENAPLLWHVSTLVGTPEGAIVDGEGTLSDLRMSPCLLISLLLLFLFRNCTSRQEALALQPFQSGEPKDVARSRSAPKPTVSSGNRFAWPAVGGR